MFDQFELHFEQARPKVNQWEVEAMVRTLEDSGCWMTAADIIAKHSMANTEQTRRALRAMASASAGRIISGQQGYKLNALATPEERDRAVRTFKSQIREMSARVNEIEAYAMTAGRN